MEQMPHHREGIQEQLDKAYDEGHRDNKVIDAAEEAIRKIKGEEIANEAMEEAYNYEGIPEKNVKIIDLKEMVNKSYPEVAEYIKSKYGDTHYIPGAEYAKHLTKNFSKAPEVLKHGGYHLFFGEALSLDGNAKITAIAPTGSAFDVYTYNLDGKTNPNYFLHSDEQVVLIEK